MNSVITLNRPDNQRYHPLDTDMVVIKQVKGSALRPCRPSPLIALCLLLLCGYAWSAPVGVLYPVMREPYQKIFDTIIQGVEQQTDTVIDRYPLTKGYNPDQLSTRIANQRNQAIVALGLRGLSAARKMRLDIPIVVGALLPSSLRSDNISSSGISLMADPELLFSQLKIFAPQIRTISVVYNPAYNRSMMEQAQRSAERMGLHLYAHEAENLSTSARVYGALLEQIDPNTTALWLLQDASTMDSDTILPLILRQAWSRNLIVFSGNLTDAKRGVLFAMYPDNLQMGRDLGLLATEAMRHPKAPKTEVMVLKALKLGVNMRTAKHLGIQFSHQALQSIDLVFPTP